MTRYIVLGCGHTGTTLISGIMHRSGFWGCDIEEHFESLPLTAINEGIKCGNINKEYEIRRFFQCLEKQSCGVWTLKDPRNAETIFTLNDYINTPFSIILNFRHPANTIKHLMMYDYDGLKGEVEKKKFCEKQYMRLYKNSLDFIAAHPEIPVLIVHYDDLVDRKLDHVISRFIGKEADFSLINPKRRRSEPVEVSPEVNGLYEEMLVLYRRNITDILLNTAALYKREPIRKKISDARFLFRKIYWRCRDSINEKSLRWRLKLTFQKKYGWESYSEGLEKPGARGDKKEPGILAK
ncbi:hypothetical protein ACFLS1_02460 [Verrucomicrobiota bacterium]